jgi:hypothetical protein
MHADFFKLLVKRYNFKKQTNALQKGNYNLKWKA